MRLKGGNITECWGWFAVVLLTFAFCLSFFFFDDGDCDYFPPWVSVDMHHLHQL